MSAPSRERSDASSVEGTAPSPARALGTFSNHERPRRMSRLCNSWMCAKSRFGRNLRCATETLRRIFTKLDSSGKIKKRGQSDCLLVAS